MIQRYAKDFLKNLIPYSLFNIDNFLNVDPSWLVVLVLLIATAHVICLIAVVLFY